jgi:two-component system, NarL family, sensor histidine kinase DevS
MTSYPETELMSDSSRKLLEAVMAISSDLDLRSVLSRIVEAATALTGARYGALGVLGSDDALGEFVTTGLTEQERARIGELPKGRGILGQLITDARPLRLTDLTRHAASSGFPPHHPPMTSFLGVPVDIRGTVFGNLYLTEKQGGGDFTDADERLVVTLASAAGLVIENARAYGLSERRRQWLEAAAALTDDLQPPVAREMALQHITTTARRVGRAWATAMVASAPEADVLTVACEPADVATVLEAVESALEALGDLPTGDPVDVVLGSVTATVVPLRARLDDGGMLVALFRPDEQRLRDLDDRELLISFADHAALALDRAMAVDDREKLAVLSDRERIARDLHDVVIQRLFAVGMQLQAASLRGGDDIRDRLASAVHDIDGTIRDVRATIFELQTQGSDTLRGDLQALARDYVPVLGFAPTVRTSGPVDTVVPEVLREQLLPVLREALSNVARHAHATRVEVEVGVALGDLTLVVIDDGIGITPHARESGLRNARERAHALGGELTLSDGDPRGLVLRWRVPLLPGGGQD